MLFDIKEVKNEKGEVEKWQVVGSFKNKDGAEVKEHVFGTHDTKEKASEQQKTLYVHVDEGKNLSDFKIEDIKKKVDDQDSPPPGGMEKGVKSGFDFRPDLYKAPEGKKKEHKRRILDFEGFLKRINYKTHDGTEQHGHGQNLKNNP
jgi:hypothetical protein